MSASPRSDQRYVFVEFEFDASSVAMIEDTRNEHAWLQSSETVPVER